MARVYVCIMTALLAAVVLLLFWFGIHSNDFKEMESFEDVTWTRDTDLIIVTTHFREDLTWLRDAKVPVVVCTKVGADEPAIPAEKRCMLPNKGREASTFLKFIVEYYYDLPRRVAFVHGHETSYHQLMPWSILETIDRVKLQYGYVNINNKDYSHKSSYDGKNHVLLRQLWHEHFAPYLGRDEPEDLHQACCAQFVVSRDRIQSLPKRAYEHWLGMFFDDEIYAKYDCNEWNLAVVFEFMWPVIFRDPDQIDLQTYLDQRFSHS